LSGKRRLGARVLKAVSSNLRLSILKLLFDRGPLSYTEIMNNLKLSPSKDAGRFAYHLKMLLNMDLIKPDVESRKYALTDLGKSVVEFAGRIEESAFRKRMLVRTSRLAIERFDRNKIAESLIREADVPIDLAQKIARETEDRLQKLDTKYLTAPLIREFVNAILIERGLEEYRHKLTRLGLPVYDVTQLIKLMGSASSNVEAILVAAGNRVIEEYTLLNILPRDISDAHLSGALNLENLACWILKLSGFLHDLRFFFKRGLMFKGYYSGFSSINPPKSFRAALNLTADVLRLASAEVSYEQGIDFFNIFLAPFIRGLSKDDIKESLECFISSVNLTVPVGVSIGIETHIPSFLAESRALGPGGSAAGIYGDYVEESQTLASLLLESFNALGEFKPIFNPSIIVKVRPETLARNEEESILYEVHKLAVYGLPYFANLSINGNVESSHMATGQKFSVNWRGDWELDIIRVGCVGDVTINLPRALYESKGDRKAFFENIYDLTEKALRALEIKYLTLKQRARENLLPFMIQGGLRDPYCMLENSLSLLSPVGLNEAVQLVTKKAIFEGDEPLKLAEEISLYMQRIINEYSRRQEIRCSLSLSPNIESSRRMAMLDIERYGLAETNISGSKEKPYYSDINTLAQNTDLPLEKYLRLEEKLSAIFNGSNLIKIPMKAETDPEQLLSITKRIISNFKIPLFTYNMPLTYCDICHRTFIGYHIKCPSCGSANAITKFIRESARYKTVYSSSQ
jgi:anaerobic ribonucleoside-triphosphate reductase